MVKVSFVEVPKNEEYKASCPTKSMELWNMHPKVYLQFNTDGEATCPYCSTEFKVVEKV